MGGFLRAESVGFGRAELRGRSTLGGQSVGDEEVAMEVGPACEAASGARVGSLNVSCRQAVASVLTRARTLVPECRLPATAPTDAGSAQRLMREIRRAASDRVHAASGARPVAAVPVVGLAVLVDDAWAALEQIRATVPVRVPAMHWVGTLRRASDVQDLLDRTGEVVHELGFPRVGISFVSSGRWTMHRAFIEGDPGLAGRVCGLSARDPRRLTTDSFEGRVVSQRRGLLVDDVASQQERTHPGIVRELGITTVLMLPLIVGGSAVGLLHADVSGLDGVALDGQERTLGNFASVYGLVLEAVRLNEAIARFQTSLASQWPTPARAARQSDWLSDLTTREAEVLELLARGMTNDEIAGTLVLSPGTVKAHVKHVLRKLGVSNRAAAVARYLRGTS